MNRSRSILFVLLLIGLAGCTSRTVDRDADLTQRVLGTWESFERSAGQDRVGLEITYEHDGTLHGWFWNHEQAADGTPFDVKVTATGRWTIAGGQIVVRDCVTNPAGKLPSAYTAVEIVDLTAREMKLRSLKDSSVLVRKRKI